MKLSRFRSCIYLNEGFCRTSSTHLRGWRSLSHGSTYATKCLPGGVETVRARREFCPFSCRADDARWNQAKVWYKFATSIIQTHLLYPLNYRTGQDMKKEGLELDRNEWWNDTTPLSPCHMFHSCQILDGSSKDEFWSCDWILQRFSSCFRRTPLPWGWTSWIPPYTKFFPSMNKEADLPRFN